MKTIDKISMKRVLSIMIIGAMTFVASAEQANAWSYEEAGAPYKGVEINILDEVTPLQEQFAKIVPDFEKETGIKVNYQLLNHFEVINKGQADLLSGRGEFDAVMAHSLQLGLLLDAGVLKAIDPYIADKALSNPDLDMDDLIQRPFKTVSSLGGQTFSFLNWNYNMVYWGRNDLFSHPGEKAAFKSKYGYELAPAKTFKQLHDIAEFFTRKAGEKLAGKTLESDFYGIVMEGLNGGGTYTPVWQIFIQNSGGKIFDDEGRPTFDTPAVVKGLKTWGDLWAFSPPGQAEYSLIDVPTVMGNGIAAQSIAYSDFVLGIDREGASALHGKFIYGAPPKAEDTKTYYSAGAPSAYFISKHSKHPEATFLFLQWAVEKKTQEKLLSSGVGVPIRDSSWPLLMKEDNAFKNLYEAMETSIAGLEAKPKIPRFFQVSDVMNRIFQQVGLKQISAEDAAKKLQQEITAICDPCVMK
mgnify:FL=1